MAKIIYTHTDEAPLLATYSFLPIIQAYAAKAGVDVETRDISVAARILAQFGLRRRRARRARRAGQDARGQHHQAAQRLRLHPAAQGRDQGAAGAGLRPPGLPGERADRRGEGRRAKYDKVKGSAVNPVLREGNSDRRAPRVGQELRQEPPAPDGRVEPPTPRPTSRPWARTTSAPTRSRSSSPADDTLTIKLVAADGTETVLKDRHQGARRRGRRRHLHETSPRCAASSPSRSPGPRPRTCCSRCTSRPR